VPQRHLGRISGRTSIVRRFAIGAGVAALLLATAACTGSEPEAVNPELLPRDTTLTTAKPTRQSLTSKLSLSGKVTLNPVFGIVAPIAGQVRYLDVPAAVGTPTKPTKVANIRVGSKDTKVEVPAGSTFSGRLVDDKSTVSLGLPIVSAKYTGYGIVADIDGAQAYRVTDTLTSVQAQVTNGPGPFACSVLGTIAALPEGSVPEPPADPAPPAGGQTVGPPVIVRPDPGNQPPGGSEPTGLRLVCIGPADVKLINGAAATIEVITAQAANVLTLPVEAIAGTQGSGKVDVLQPDGTRKTTDVVLGLTDGKVIEIKSGLTGDETVAVPGPNLPAPPANPNDPGFRK
jgi:hypothetical protein